MVPVPAHGLKYFAETFVVADVVADQVGGSHCVTPPLRRARCRNAIRCRPAPDPAPDFGTLPPRGNADTSTDGSALASPSPHPFPATMAPAGTQCSRLSPAGIPPFRKPAPTGYRSWSTKSAHASR